MNADQVAQCFASRQSPLSPEDKVANPLPTISEEATLLVPSPPNPPRRSPPVRRMSMSFPTQRSPAMRRLFEEAQEGDFSIRVIPSNALPPREHEVQAHQPAANLCKRVNRAFLRCFRWLLP